MQPDAAIPLTGDAFAETAIGTAVLDVQGRLLDANRALCTMLGRASADLEGLRLEDLAHREDAAAVHRLVEHVRVGGRFAKQVEVRLRRGRGRPMWALLTLARVRPGRGRPAHLLLHALDVTSTRRREQRLRRLADEDSLSGLHNRRRFDEELRRQVARSRRHGEDAALVVLDLDGFKQVNDRLGHAVGDAVIKEVGDLLRDRFRTTDVVARIGGDEFGMVLPRASVEEAARIADELCAALADHAFESLPGSERLGASIGIAGIDRGTADADAAYAAADAALYDAKRAGRSCAVVAA